MNRFCFRKLFCLWVGKKTSREYALRFSIFSKLTLWKYYRNFHRVHYMLELFFKSLTAVLVCHLTMFCLFHIFMVWVALLDCHLTHIFEIQPLFIGYRCLSGQNGIWAKFYHFWPENDDEKWSKKKEV